MKRSLTLTNRRMAVLANLLTYPLIVWLVAYAPFGQPLNGMGMGILIMIFVATMVYLFYKTDLWIFANAPDDQLDERQNVVRNYAYRHAYTFLSPLLILAFVYAMITSDKGVWSLNSPAQITVLFFEVLFLTLTLPSIVLAWMEPEI